MRVLETGLESLQDLDDGLTEGGREGGRKGGREGGSILEIPEMLSPTRGRTRGREGGRKEGREGGREDVPYWPPHSCPNAGRRQ